MSDNGFTLISPTISLTIIIVTIFYFSPQQTKYQKLDIMHSVHLHLLPLIFSYILQRLFAGFS